MKAILIFALLMINYVFQTVLFKDVQLFNVTPDLGVALIVSIAILNGSLYGGLSGFVYGMIIGVCFSYSRASAIFYVFEYAAVGALAGLLANKVNIGRWTKAVVFSISGFILKELIELIPRMILRIPFGFLTFLKVILLGAVMTAIVMIPIHLLMVWLHKFRFMRPSDDDRIFIK